MVTVWQITVLVDEMRLTEVEAVPTPFTTALNNDPPGEPTDGEVDTITGVSVIPPEVRRLAPTGVPDAKLTSMFVEVDESMLIMVTTIEVTEAEAIV
jgi:hypothetical protein